VNQILLGILICIFGYLVGSLSFALYITKRIKGVDVRDAGSKHATTTNTIRQAGWGPGALVLILDIAKGYLPVWVALNYSELFWVVPLTAALAVAGHCWPLFAQFRGGMGLATAGGAFLAIKPLSFLIALGLLIALTLIIKHSARAALVSGLLFALEFYLFGERGLLIWAAGVVGIVLAIRFLSDWQREYRELWLDREAE
jgi:glycerol-3-phosphate acyltransferase PlsY